MSDKRKIMLVEDDPDEQVLTLRALKKNDIGDDVVVARDRAEALDYLFDAIEHTGRDINAVPRLILLGLKLPKMNGLEVLRRLRADERTRSLPVVMLISCEREQDLVDEDGSHVDGCISRPVDFARFSRDVRQLKPLL